MKSIFVIIGCMFIALSSMAQNSLTLSDEGRGHFSVALRLVESATSVEDLIQVSEEFESVLKTDPNYPDTYINLCKIYSRIGAEKGEPYFSKAETVLAKYKSLSPSDTTGFREEEIALNAMKHKYENNLLRRKTGTWYLSSGTGHVYCPNRITISETEPHKMFFAFPSLSNGYTSEKSFSGINLSNNTIKVSLTENVEFGDFSVGRGSITDHDILVWHRDGSRGTNGGVTGYYSAYQYSKRAVKEESIVYYTLSFEGNRLIVTWTHTGEYIDSSERKIFYQSANPQTVIFEKH